jgi:hypothetical protein
MAWTIRVCGPQPEAFLADLRRFAPACEKVKWEIEDKEGALQTKLRPVDGRGLRAYHR